MTDGPTEAVARLATSLRWQDLAQDVRNAAIRHCIDTLGVILAGSGNPLAKRIADLLPENQGRDGVPFPGLAKDLFPLDAAYIAGIAGHGIELDDGYRQGSVHPGVVVVPALYAVAHTQPVTGVKFLESLIVGYETIIAIARGCHPSLRRQGFHPTGAVGPLGGAAAVSKIFDASYSQTCDALGLAASSAAGLFAFLGGNADVKRLHAGHAAREGLWAAILARDGISGPPSVLEGKDGFAQAFAGRNGGAAISVPPQTPFGITDCYIKPYPCCRHLQPALQALIDLVKTNRLEPTEVKRIDIETYGIAAAHAATGWDDFASAQLSFPYILSLGLYEGDVQLGHFSQDALADPRHEAVRRITHVAATPEMDALYPDQRPARVTLTTERGSFKKYLGEAPGAPEFPMGDDDISAKFLNLVAPKLGESRSTDLLDALWRLDAHQDVSSLLRAISRT